MWVSHPREGGVLQSPGTHDGPRTAPSRGLAAPPRVHSVRTVLPEHRGGAPRARDPAPGEDLRRHRGRDRDVHGIPGRVHADDTGRADEPLLEDVRRSGAGREDHAVDLPRRAKGARVAASRAVASRRARIEPNALARIRASPRPPRASTPLARARSEPPSRTPNRTHPNPSCAPHPARRSSSPKSPRTRRRARRNVAR